ncbi:PAS domain S-box-containing protein [Silvibacterium bohemicum]|uniref:histidine kinase n=1 Tax=Silvibacterium bohemicum TaxID=1577686 RepID=A0A841JWI3_9BACT|nr:PAS domain S-box protein [Silvibacterium bohemicum]MBB6144807.1 PAS domain S-box-containing protein [Silvibacterium bohemicum]
MPDSTTSLNHSEVERLKALLHYEILDTPPDPALTEIAALAAQITHAPYAYIGFADASRLWFKACIGFSESEQPIISSACQFTMLAAQPLLIEDAANDARFPAGAIPLGKNIRCRSYLASPLVTSSGVVLGALAVLSPDPGAFRIADGTALEVLTRQILTRLDYYSSTRREGQARRRVEEALTAERNFVSAVLDTISALVLVLDTSGRIVRFNRACEQISGFSFAELMGRPFPEELFGPDDRVRARELFDAARSGAAAEPFELHWISKESSRRRIAWTATTLMDAAGTINYIIATGVDVTEQREAELALRSSELRYRQLIEGSLGMICTHDLNGYLLSINAHAAATMGYTPEELVGRYMLDFIQISHRQGWETYWKAMAEYGEDQGLLYINRKDGTPCVIAFRNKLVQLPGSPPFVLGHGIDMTEKIDAENKLHALMRQRESILDSVGDGIYGIDMEGRIVFVNQVGAHILGYTPEELQGQLIHPLIHHSKSDGTPYRDEECPILNTLHRNHPARVRDEVFWRRDGSSVPIEYVACPLIDDGKITGAVVAYQDVTERRRLERMKDEFISTVSHELRTPLTSLRAALGLVASGALASRPEKNEQMIEVAMGNCNRLVNLVNDILDFERIGTGKLRLDSSDITASELLRRATERELTDAQRAGLRFRIEAEPINLWVDSERIVQTLTKLLANAIKFSPPNSEIRLRAQAISETEALIEVQDQGRGIPAEMLDNIFERFQQGDASDSRASGGTGLGLALCRSLVGLHGGKIWAESTVGLGSSFFFTVPRTRHRSKQIVN